jgi:hypothetical protein
MRVRCVRFKLWQFMAVIGVLVAMLATLQTWRRWSYRQRAAYHAEYEQLFRELMRVQDNDDSGSFGYLSFDVDADWHARMRRKYEQAARDPWLFGSADPPETR